MQRKPWLAAILSLWLPGLGHLYAGAIERGFAVWCLWCVGIVATFAVTMVLPSMVGALAPWIVLLAGLIAVMIDAVRVARRAPRPFVPQSYNRWYVYLLLPLLAGAGIWGPLRGIIRRNFYEAFKIPTESMAPTILRGDYLFATRLRGAIQRGDIVIFHHDGNLFVKRALGLPGDTLAMRRDSLHVDGRWIAEPYAMHIDAGANTDGPTRSTWGPLVVPQHQYFMLGDNRDNSLDSRAYGFIDADSVIKRPIGIYFSRDSSGAIRWSRIGRAVSR